MLSRALLLAGLELPCDAARLQFAGPPSSSASAAEASLPISPSPWASFLVLVGGEPVARLPPTFVEVCRVRDVPLWLRMRRGLRLIVSS